jgi:hypothetical protein
LLVVVQVERMLAVAVALVDTKLEPLLSQQELLTQSPLAVVEQETLVLKLEPTEIYHA